MRNFQGIIFILTRKYRDIFKPANIYRFSWFNKLDHVFHINIIAYCRQNRHVRLAIYTDLLTLNKLFFIFGCIWLNKIVTFKSIHQRCSTATLLKKRLWHRCFPVNFVKFLRTQFLQNTSGRLLLYVFKNILCTLSTSRSVQTCHYYLL